MSGLDPTPLLETRRLKLRPMSSEDEKVMFEIFSDSETMRYWDAPPHPNREHTRERLAQQLIAAAEGERLWWGVERREDGRLLGNVSLFFDRSQRHHAAEIGFILGREHWRQGYGGEAQRAVVAHAFDALGLHRLQAEADPRNVASVRSLERLGFQREGLLREACDVDGEISDSVVLGLLRTDRDGS